MLERSDVHNLTLETDRGIRDYDISNDVLVQVVTHPGNPWELYAGTRDGKIARPLTTHNSAWLKDKKLSPYTGHRLVQADGITVDYWTIKPPDFDPTKKHPLLVQIHGGPTAMWGPGEQSMWHEFQFYAARGYVVMFANPRGLGRLRQGFPAQPTSRTGAPARQATCSPRRRSSPRNPTSTRTARC